MLKENLVAKFKLNFEEFIKIKKKLYGEYWIYAIKTNVRILYLTAKMQDLVETQEFMLINTPNINIKVPVSSIFVELSEFQTIFNEPLEDDQKFILKYLNEFISSFPESKSFDLSNFKKHLKNSPKIRRILFGRKHFNDESLYEKFWSIKIDKKDSDEEHELLNEEKEEVFFECLYHIWNEFRLWEKPEALALVISGTF
ncbi:hypothetical protein ACKWTF_007026 [Chironomus riparius]